MPRQRVVPAGKILNPQSNRFVEIGGKTYRDLVKKGVIRPVNVPINAVEVPRPVKKCKPGYVINPRTNYPIKKNGQTYNRLKRQGVNFHDDDIIAVDNVEIVAPQVNRNDCKNRNTFLMFTDIEDVEKEDFIMLPNGYCFSVSELISALEQTEFNNKNPHVINEDLFTEENKNVWKKYPQLNQLVSEYFKKKKEERMSETNIISRHMNVLYEICKAGRICYFDNIQNAGNNSEHFEYSIEALGNLSEMVEKLPQDAKNIFKNLKTLNSSLSTLIKDANEGNLCIHGIGIKLIKIFINTFLTIENKMKNTSRPLKYDPLKSGLYLISHKNNIAIVNAEVRLSPLPEKDIYYYNTHIKPVVENVGHSSLLWKVEKMRKEGLSVIYSKECPNDSFAATLESSDEWWELEEWRKIRLEDGYCFDLLFLIKTITDQLNVSKMTNPYPSYPNNIFTRGILKMKDLINIRRRIMNNYIQVAPCLTKFLHNPELFWTEDTSYSNSDEWREEVVGLFEREMNFSRYLNRIDEDRVPLINGHWVKKENRRTRHENIVLGYLGNPDDTRIMRERPYIVDDKYYYEDIGNNYALTHFYNDVNVL